MKITLSLLIVSFIHIYNAQEILVEEIRVECGNEYFSETSTSQPALIARGKATWCQNGFIYSIVSIGDTIKVEAFRNNLPFTGTAIDYDFAGNMIGRYEFKNGFIQKLETFYEDRVLKTKLSFENGVPNGKHMSYYPNSNIEREFNYLNGFLNGELRTFYSDGTLTSQTNYKNGIMEGPFYYHCLNEMDLPTCYQKGFAINGIETITEDSCN